MEFMAAWWWVGRRVKELFRWRLSAPQMIYSSAHFHSPLMAIKVSISLLMFSSTQIYLTNDFDLQQLELYKTIYDDDERTVAIPPSASWSSCFPWLAFCYASLLFRLLVDCDAMTRPQFCITYEVTNSLKCEKHGKHIRCFLGILTFRLKIL